jgi:hypothetical protein
MEVAIELLWEDKLAHPQWPHVFVVPRFMTHMWRRDLGKNADMLFTVPAGVPFWGGSQFEQLIVAIVFPLAHVSNYTGRWVVRGTNVGRYYKHALEEGFKCPPRALGKGMPHSGGHGKWDSTGVSGSHLPGGGDPGQLHDLDRSLPGVFNDPEAGSRTLLRELLASAGKLPPCRSVWCSKCYQESPNDHFPRLDHLQSGSDPEVDLTYKQTR